MPTADITIVSLGSPVYPWADVSGKLVVSHSQSIRVAILQAGMTSGEPSIAFAVPMEDDEGRWFFFETSLSLLDGIVGAATGAKNRWATESN